MDRGGDRDPALAEALDHVDRPRRPGEVERRGQDLGDRAGERALVGRGQRVLDDVGVEVELRIVDPVREVEPQRHRDHPAPERRDQVDARGDRGADGVGAERSGGRRGVDRQPDDVAVDGAVLRRDELRINRCELAHGPLPPCGHTLCTDIESTILASHPQGRDVL
jgi:hypothetical protein